MFCFLLIFWFIIFFSWYLFRQYEYSKKVSNIPCPHKLPILGHALLFMNSPSKIFQKVSKLTFQYSRMLIIWIGPWLNIFLYDPKDVEIVLKASKNMKKAYQYNFLRPWLGDSILLSTGEKFRRNKKILVQTFHINNLKGYIKVFNKHSMNMAINLAEKCDAGEFALDNFISLSTMHSLLETSLGVDKELLGDDALKYAKAVEKVSCCCQIRAQKLWLYPDFIYKYSSLKKKQDAYQAILDDLTNRVIAERKKEFENRENKLENEETLKKNTIFLDNFFSAVKENGECFTQEEIKDEVMTMMFAGQDTTTVSIGFALSMMACHENVQNKVYAELCEVFGDNSDSEVTYEDTLKMKYMEQVIQETWRLFPPIPLVAKTPVEDLQLADNHIIPKGCTVVAFIMLLHRNKNIFPHPSKFNPDNFLPEAIQKRHPCSFIPFSAGYRTCIGPKYAMLVIKVTIANILRKYQVYSERRSKDFVLAVQTTLRRKEGFLINLQRRKVTPTIIY